MIQARKRFVRYAMLAILVLLLALLSIINITLYTMAGEDADQLTARIAEQQGTFSTRMEGDQRSMRFRDGHPNGFRFLGPNAPELESSLRYFTFAFDAEGNAQPVAWFISSVDEAEALSWARSLLTEQQTGWTSTAYRYRVYSSAGRTYVTVIDQSRELIACYRILIISCIGLVIGLVLSYLVLMRIGKRLFHPLEEADRKEKQFIASAEQEFNIPLTVIQADVDILERTHGESEETQSIHRQVKRMSELMKGLRTMGAYEAPETRTAPIDLAAMAREAGEAARPLFAEMDRTLTLHAEEATLLSADAAAMRNIMDELLRNALTFSLSHAELSVRSEEGHVLLIATNDTELPAGEYNQVFDRFVRLDNAKEKSGSGLGLAHVRDIVQAHNGRMSASVADGIFILRIRF